MLSTSVCGFLFSTPLEGKGHERQEHHRRTEDASVLWTLHDSQAFLHHRFGNYVNFVAVLTHALYSSLTTNIGGSVVFSFE